MSRPSGVSNGPLQYRLSSVRLVFRESHSRPWSLLENGGVKEGLVTRLDGGDRRSGGQVGPVLDGRAEVC